ncbi:MAG: cellulose biosynthesis cyclic di-GMP-binding regulatory protein BcsB [Myxococcota bacterium]
MKQGQNGLQHRAQHPEGHTHTHYAGDTRSHARTRVLKPVHSRVKFSSLAGLLVLLGLFLFLCSLNAPLHAQERLSASAPLLEGQGLRLQGMMSAVEVPIQLPPTWKLTEPGRVVLQLTASELLQDSNLSVLLNQREIKSLPVSPGTSRVEVTLSPAILQSGWNTLQLKAQLRTSADACRDLDNPALWVRVEPSSELILPHTLREVTPDLAAFPNFYTAPERLDKPIRVQFVLPEALTEAGLEVAGLLAVRLGQTRGLRPGSLDASWAGQLVAPQISDAHILSVLTLPAVEGLAASLEGLGGDLRNLRTALQNLQLAAGEVGFIESRHPLNPLKRMMWVVGADEAGLKRAARGLAGPSSAAPLKGVALKWVQDPPVAAYVPSSELVPLFPQLEAQTLNAGLTLRGLSQPRAEVRVPVPRHRVLKPEAELRLALRYALSLQRHGMLEVVLNDKPFYSLELLPEAAHEAPVTRTVALPLPGDVHREGLLRLQFRLYLDTTDLDCSRTFDESAWVSVLSGSSLYLPYERPQTRAISQWPERFAEGVSLREVGLVLASGTDRDALSLYMVAASTLGAQRPLDARLELKQHFDGAFEALPSAEKAGREWLVVAPRLSPGLRRTLGGNLLLPVDATGELVQPLSGFGPEPMPSVQGTGIQILRSPWDSSRAVLLAMSLGEAGLRKSAPFFAQFWYDGPLEGNVGAVTGEGILQLGQRPDAAVPLMVEAQPGSGVPWYGLPLSLLGFAVALTVLWWVRRGRS